VEDDGLMMMMMMMMTIMVMIMGVAVLIDSGGRCAGRSEVVL